MKRLYLYKILLSSLLSFVFVVGNFVYAPAPAMAGFDTVSACAKKPSCAAGLASELKPALSAPIVPANPAAKTVLAEVIQNGKVVATTPVSISRGSTWTAPIVLGAGAASISKMNVNMSSLAKDVKTTYCLAHPTFPPCGSRILHGGITTDIHDAPNWRIAKTPTITAISSVPGTSPPRPGWAVTGTSTPCGSNTNSASFTIYIEKQTQVSGQWVNTYTDVEVEVGVCGVKSGLVYKKTESKPFEQWTPQERSIAANYYNYENVVNHTSVQKVVNNNKNYNYQYGSKFYSDNDVDYGLDITVNLSADNITYVTGDTENNIDITYGDNNTYNFSFSTTSVNAPIGIGGDDDDEDNIADDGGLETDLDNPPESPSKDYPTYSVPDPLIPEIFEDELCNLSEKQDCSLPSIVKEGSPPFWDHVSLTLFDRFPFDIVGDIPSAGGSNDCPYVTGYNGETLEVCEVKTVLSYTKYPIWVHTIIRLALH